MFWNILNKMMTGHNVITQELLKVVTDTHNTVQKIFNLYLQETNVLRRDLNKTYGAFTL